MRKLLDYESGVFQFLGKVVDCICLSLIWTLLSVPIITIGAATTALYYSVNKSVRHGNGYALRGFWDSFKLNFKQATLGWIGILLVFGVFTADFYIFYQSEKYASLSVALLILMAIVVVYAIYLFAHIARFTDKLKKALRNSFIMLYLNMHWSILLLIIFLISILAGFFVPFAIFFVPSLSMLLISLILERVFKKYMKPAELALEEE